jgi:hypothetical protein
MQLDSCAAALGLTSAGQDERKLAAFRSNPRRLRNRTTKTSTSVVSSSEAVRFLGISQRKLSVSGEHQRDLMEAARPTITDDSRHGSQRPLKADLHAKPGTVYTEGTVLQSSWMSGGQNDS